MRSLLPSKRVTAGWIIITFIFSIISVTEVSIVSQAPSAGMEAVDAIELMIVHNDKLHHDGLHSYDNYLLNLKGLDNIRAELEKTILSLEPINDTDNRLPKNIKCEHEGKVFAVGTMKTGTTSMNLALRNLGYKCLGDSCIHVGNWDFLIDGVFLWQPFEVINLVLLKIPTLWERYANNSFHALNFGDSPWCFMYPIFDRLYPGSKFIFMKRKDDEQYINSYLKYIAAHKKLYAKQGLTDEMFTSLALRRYHLHNKMVQEYFENRPNDLLTVTIGSEDDENIMQSIGDFLGCGGAGRRFPKKNRAGSRGRPITVNPDALDWKATFQIDESDEYSKIPYLSRHPATHDLSVHLADKDDFKLNWDVFLVEELQGKADTVI